MQAGRGFEKCLSLYPMKSWEPIFARISQLDDFGYSHFIHLFPAVIHRYSHFAHSRKSPKSLHSAPNSIHDNTHSHNALLWKN